MPFSNWRLRFQARHRFLLALGVTLLLVLVYVLGENRQNVRVLEAEVFPPRRLILVVESCEGSPEAVVTETDREIQVRVNAASTRFRGGGGDCRDTVEVILDSDLADRVVLDFTSRTPVPLKLISSTTG